MGGELAAAAATMTKKKKKKGRPSLLEIQKRTLKQQQQLQQQQQQSPNSTNPNYHRRSTRKNPNFDDDEDDDDADNDDDDDERQRKKHKLLLGLNNSSSSNNHRQQQYSIFNGSDALKHSKISGFRTGSDQLEEKFSKATVIPDGLPVECGPTTPLPDKKLLVFVLDRLQKKDTYGVFSEPVDPEELPDYHDIIADPMDFGTVRKKLDGGAYFNLEQLEKDVFLICSNAMQYNAPDTVYFRQARSIQEIAKKDFENLRQDSDDSEPQVQPKVARRGRPPKSLKKSMDTSPSDRLASEFSSDATPANGGDNTSWSSAHYLRRGSMTSFKHRLADASVRASPGSHTGETYTSWASEWENEFPASVVKAVMKYGKKLSTFEENKRDTYNDSLASEREPSVLTTFEGELKQLMVVGLNSENGYASSLARFAADLGPAVWKIASKKIESVMPSGVEFSPGQAGEKKGTGQQLYLYSEKQKSLNNNIFIDHSTRILSPTTSGSNSAIGNRCSLQGGDDTESIREMNSQSESISLSGISPGPPPHIQSRPVVHCDTNGASGSGGFGLNNPPQMGMVRHPTQPGHSRSDDSTVPSQMFRMVPNHNQAICSMPASDQDLNLHNLADSSSRVIHTGNSLLIGPGSRSHEPNMGYQGDSSWQGLPAFQKQDIYPYPPPDLNVRFLAPGSPNSSIHIGSPQQPDLALQL